MNVIERERALEANIKRLSALQDALASLAQVESTIDEAVRLDELTEPLLEITAGLANSSMRKVDLDPIYSAPDVGGKNNIATKITATTESAYAQLVPIRNRAVGHLIAKYTELVVSQLAWLDKYKTNVYTAVRYASSYGITNLEGVRSVSDDEVRRLIAYGIEKTTHQKSSEIIIGMFDEITSNVIATATNPYLADYIERNVDRFEQGDGYSPVRMGDGGNGLKANVELFNSKYAVFSSGDGLANCNHYVGGDRVDAFQPEAMSAQDIAVLIEKLTANTEKLTKAVEDSPLLTSDELNARIGEALVDSPLDIKLYRSYYGDSSVSEEVAVMINRIADARLSQLRYVSYCLGNLIGALPLIMNYCLRDKIN